MTSITVSFERGSFELRRWLFRADDSLFAFSSFSRTELESKRASGNSFTAPPVDRKRNHMRLSSVMPTSFDITSAGAFQFLTLILYFFWYALKILLRLFLVFQLYMKNFVLHVHVHIGRCFRVLQLPPEAWLRMSLHHGSITWIRIYPNGRVSLRNLGESGHIPAQELSFA